MHVGWDGGLFSINLMFLHEMSYEEERDEPSMDAHVVHAGLCRPRRSGCSLEAMPKPADSKSEDYNFGLGIAIR